jgi:Fe-Mn family superoxide dismutase
MRFRIAPLFCRPWTLNGMSPRLIESHYEHNYGAALSRLNVVTQELEAIDIGAATPQMISRLKREQIDLLNATLLHELYFGSLGGDGRTLPETISNAIPARRSSFDRGGSWYASPYPLFLLLKD